MFRKRSGTKSTAARRKRRVGDDEDDNDNGTATTAATNRGGHDPSLRNRKNARTFRANDSSSDEEGGGGPSANGEVGTSALLAELKGAKSAASGRGGRTRQQGDGAPASSSAGGGVAGTKRGVMHEYKPDSTGPLTAQEMATRAAEHHPEEDGKAAAGAGRGEQAGEDADPGDGIYRGRKEKRSKFLAGPIKAPTFVRTTCRFDYQPDVCKDYKDTGFCGFGDTCIYLHDRGDTMSGWQLERQWEERKKAERDAKEKELNRFMEGTEEGLNDGTIDAQEGGGADRGSSSDGVPFACFICRSPFNNPVVTSCGHYFCQSCIMKSFQSDPCCPICKKDTFGVFNHPSKLYSKKKRTVGDKSWEEYAKAIQKGA